MARVRLIERHAAVKCSGFRSWKPAARGLQLLSDLVGYVRGSIFQHRRAAQLRPAGARGLIAQATTDDFHAAEDVGTIRNVAVRRPGAIQNVAVRLRVSRPRLRSRALMLKARSTRFQQRAGAAGLPRSHAPRTPRRSNLPVAQVSAPDADPRTARWKKRRRHGLSRASLSDAFRRRLFACA